MIARHPVCRATLLAASLAAFPACSQNAAEDRAATLENAAEQSEPAAALVLNDAAEAMANDEVSDIDRATDEALNEAAAAAREDVR